MTEPHFTDHQNIPNVARLKFVIEQLSPVGVPGEEYRQPSLRVEYLYAQEKYQLTVRSGTARKLDIIGPIVWTLVAEESEVATKIKTAAGRYKVPRNRVFFADTARKMLELSTRKPAQE